MLEKAVLADKAEADSKIAQIPGRCFDPLASLMIDGCLEKGCDMFQGGSELGPHWSFYAYGLGTAADAMASVKKAVYEDGRFSIGQMAEILQSNFAGNEEIRLFLENRTPHYGNDQDDVDAVARAILSKMCGTALRLNAPHARDKYVSTLFGYFFPYLPRGDHRGDPRTAAEGRTASATAWGRLRGRTQAGRPTCSTPSSSLTTGGYGRVCPEPEDQPGNYQKRSRDPCAEGAFAGLHHGRRPAAAGLPCRRTGAQAGETGAGEISKSDRKGRRLLRIFRELLDASLAGRDHCTHSLWLLKRSNG